jgi:hypothetical protein
MILAASSILLSFAQDGEFHDDHINDLTDTFPNDYAPMVIPVNGKGISIAPVITCTTLENDVFMPNHYPCKSAQTLLVDGDWVDKDANYTYLFEDWTDYDWNDIIVSLYATTIDVIEAEICIEDREAAWKNPFGVEITLANMAFGVQVYWNSTDYPREHFVKVNPGEPVGIELFSESNTGDTAFITIIPLVPPKYTLTITSTSGGSTNPVPGSYLYDEGSVGSVTAIPESSYIFDHWELDEVNVGISNPINVTMDADHGLHAVFEQLHTFVITSSAGGTTDPSPGSYQHSHGTEVVVTAISDSGHTLDYWKLDDVDMGSVTSISVTMNKNHTLHAIFKEFQFPLPPVGGHAIPIDVSHLLASKIELPLETGLAFVLLVAIISTVILIRRKTRH